jgi:hypothetical protein
MVHTNGSGHQLSDVLTTEPVEHDVIRQLGQELAQYRVDMAFMNARMQRVREAITALWANHTPVEAGCGDCPPVGVIVPADTLLTLQSLVG